MPKDSYINALAWFNSILRRDISHNFHYNQIDGVIMCDTELVMRNDVLLKNQKHINDHSNMAGKKMFSLGLLSWGYIQNRRVGRRIIVLLQWQCSPALVTILCSALTIFIMTSLPEKSLSLPPNDRQNDLAVLPPGGEIFIINLFILVLFILCTLYKGR